MNALVHRDFEVTGTIEVEHSPERLMVSSLGGLVYGVTPENILTHPSTPRNRLLMETVTMLQVAERTGQGVDRAYREMLRSGKPPPSYEDHETRVVARLDGGVGNDAFVRFLNSDFMESSLTVDVEILLAIAHLRTHKSITAIELAPQIQRSQGDAHPSSGASGRSGPHCAKQAHGATGGPPLCAHRRGAYRHGEGCGVPPIHRR